MGTGRDDGRAKARAEGSPSDRSDDALDVDVPATVVCALCGDADCPGCAHERSRSGIVSIVAWERPGRVFERLWSTARSSTKEAEPFFATLPDGPIGPALRFAALSELIASTAMLLLTIPLAAMVAPAWLAHLALDPSARLGALRAAAVGLPALAAMLVLAHAAHGLSLDVGARRVGGRAARRRALRFGLYATGWDVVIGPFGAAVLGAREGLSAALGVTQLATGLPGRSARAFLRGAYGLDGVGAARAIRVSYAAAIAVTLLGALAILGGFAWLVFD